MDDKLITRGVLFDIIRNANRNETISTTYECIWFMQQLIDKLGELPARWPDGRRMAQSILLNTDLVLKQDMIEAVKDTVKHTISFNNKYILANKIINSIEGCDI